MYSCAIPWYYEQQIWEMFFLMIPSMQVGMHGIFVGLGEFVGGLLFGILGSHIVKVGEKEQIRQCLAFYSWSYSWSTNRSKLRFVFLIATKFLFMVCVINLSVKKELKRS